jgi:hypothetical protein
MDKLIGCFMAAFFVVVFTTLTAWLLKIGWNYLTPLFNGPQITFWHALAAICILSIVGSFFKKS